MDTIQKDTSYVTVQFILETGQWSGPVTASKIIKSNDEWKKTLSDEQYRVTRKQGTELPYSCALESAHSPGIYSCVCCGLPLFKAETKFHSGTGWPSFFQPAVPENITEKVDKSHGMIRTEIVCARCDAHLGHVFNDGPPPTRLRYCINGAALRFTEADSTGILHADHNLQQATFGAGCFWGVEDAFRTIRGVEATAVGFMGGTVENPTYHQVCTENTHHAEVIHLIYDRSIISYDKLLDTFWSIHDPASLNRQGPDIGDQYRSVIFYHTAEQKTAAEVSKAALEKKAGLSVLSGKPKKIVTQIVEAKPFYRAEEYHQRYHQKEGGSCFIR